MKKLKFILLILILLLAMSCEKFLDQPPRDEIGTESYWKSSKDLENYILQYYPELPAHGHVSSNQVAREDEKSDNMIIQTPNELLNGERVVSTGTWTSEWSDIRSINIFFDNYHKCGDSFDTWKHFLGEAYFFRAWFYFSLVQQYGDVPWYNTQLFPESEDLLTKPRDPRTLVVDSILSNLDKAVLYLNTREDAEGNNRRLNKEAALAFKTRVALYEGTWQKYHKLLNDEFATPGADPDKYFLACLNAAEELINGDYTVGIYNTGNPDIDYYTLFGLDNMSAIDEVLLYRAYNAADQVGNNVNVWAGRRPGQMGLTWDLVTSYLAADGTPYDYMGLAQSSKGNEFLTAIATNCDPRLKATIWSPGELLVASTGETYSKPAIDLNGDDGCPTGFQYRKYSNPASPEFATTTCETGRIIFRFGEVLINYAEAQYELDGTVATEQLNLLRARTGMPDFTVNPQDSDPNRVDYGYPVSDELYEIRRERRVETALEALRESDWKRWAAHALFAGKRPKGYPFNPSEFSFTPRLDENGLIDYLQGDLPNGYQFKPERDYLNSIPLTEITLNPALTQNPGW